MQYYGFFLLVSIFFGFCTSKDIKKSVTVTKHKSHSFILPDSLPSYSWDVNYDIQNSIVAQIAAPRGSKRIAVQSGFFEEWLRYLPLKKEGSPVLLHNGSEKFWNVHHRVVDIDTGKRDLQQCADAVMRLKSEYHFGRGEVDKIAFNFTNGTRVHYKDWQKGKKPFIKGNKVRFSAENGGLDTSYKSFKKYMNVIFAYAGTASLAKEMQPVSLEEMRIGDVFIQGGFPGHAVIVVDMAIDSNGSKSFLLAQSYMPAQDIHVLKNPNNKALSPWYTLDFEGDLKTPEWTFKKTDLKRFR